MASWGDDAAEQHAENVLRTLGVPRVEAAEIAHRPLPEPAGEVARQPIRPA